MPTTDDQQFDAIIERLDEAVRVASFAEIAELSREAAGIDSDLSQRLEVAELLFEAGWFDLAERWLARMETQIAGGARATSVTLRHYLWLQVNIAWQRGDFGKAAQRLQQCEKHLDPVAPTRALRLAAEALSMLPDGRQVQRHSSAPRRVGWMSTTHDSVERAMNALRIDSCGVDARLAAASILALALPDAAALREIAVDNTLDDPAGRAYRDVAIEVLGRLGHDAPESSPVTFKHAEHQHAYDAAYRHIAPVINRVMGAHTTASADDPTPFDLLSA
jgi:hypothetical protein